MWENLPKKEGISKKGNWHWETTEDCQYGRWKSIIDYKVDWYTTNFMMDYKRLQKTTKVGHRLQSLPIDYKRLQKLDTDYKVYS